MFAFQAINHIIKENKRSIGEIRQKESCSSNRKEHFQESNAKIKKYELLENDTITVSGVKLYRIKALINFGDVKKGDLGGYIQSEYNLRNIFESDKDTSWVYDNAKVYGNARVYFDSKVYGNAEVFGNAEIYNKSEVFGNAQVFGNVEIYHCVKIYENAKVYENAIVYRNVEIFGNAEIHGRAKVFGKAEICGELEIYSK